jgi:hypothetical protein
VNEQSALSGAITKFSENEDEQMHVQVMQALLAQLTSFLGVAEAVDRLVDSNQMSSFDALVEHTVRNLIECRRVVLWSRVSSAAVFISRTGSIVVPEGEGLVGKAAAEKQRWLLYSPSADSAYNPEYDAQFCGTAKIVTFQPVVREGECCWIIEIVDRLDSQGTVVPPSQEDFVIIDFLVGCLVRLRAQENRDDALISKLIAESTPSVLTTHQITPLLNTLEKTARKLIGCASLQLFFVTESGEALYRVEGDITDRARRREMAIDNAGIVGHACARSQIVNAPVAKEHPGFDNSVDGEHPKGSVLAVPLITSKGVVLAAIARQKLSGMMFTPYDETLLEAILRVSHGRD